MPAPFNSTINYVGTVRGRIGYAFGTWMPYLTGGFAWGHTDVNLNDVDGNPFQSVRLPRTASYPNTSPAITTTMMSIGRAK
jgi:opacity protein-like surface antigen